jgi:hypothetical protein
MHRSRRPGGCPANGWPVSARSLPAIAVGTPRRGPAARWLWLPARRRGWPPGDLVTGDAGCHRRRAFLLSWIGGPKPLRWMTVAPVFGTPRGMYSGESTRVQDGA